LRHSLATLLAAFLVFYFFLDKRHGLVYDPPPKKADVFISAGGNMETIEKCLQGIDVSKFNMSRAQGRALIKAFFDEAKKRLLEGKELTFAKFVTFRPQQRRERRAYNLKTKRVELLPADVFLTARISKGFQNVFKRSRGR
jgi:nucleoid DNA-binding protein